MTEKKQVSEERTAAASYILTFYQEIIALTHNYANYENLMLELEQKYGSEDEKMSPEEQDIIKQFSSILRYYIRVTYVRYVSIMAGVGQKTDKKITDLFDKIKDQYIVIRADAQDYVTALNGVLVNKIIKNLLESSQELVQQLYSGTEEEKGENA